MKTAMRHTGRGLALMGLLGVLGACSGKEDEPAGPKPQPTIVAQVDHTVRFATFNVSLHRPTQGQLARDLATPDDPQARQVAQIIQRTRPQVLLLNEFDFDPASAQRFITHYLAIPQAPELEPIVYPYTYQPTVNTGQPTGVDLNRDGKIAGAPDSHGWGAFPGQYGMVLLSQFPIDHEHIRTFQTLRWADMPGHRMPRDHYPPDAANVLRLSSKTHADVPILIPGRIVHALISHPTPPTFDGPEDRNGKRNHDEIRLWADYLTDAPDTYLVDDQGLRGGLNPGALCVILGDLNADPFDGDSIPGAIQQLLDHPRLVTAPTPSSRGAIAAAKRVGGKSWSHAGPHMHDTAAFGPTPGHLRVDYALPGKPMRIRRAGVYWTTPREPWHDLMQASDHRMVWVDLTVPGATSTTPVMPLPTTKR